jgi:hypothetical protein
LALNDKNLSRTAEMRRAKTLLIHFCHANSAIICLFILALGFSRRPVLLLAASIMAKLGVGVHWFGINEGIL